MHRIYGLTCSERYAVNADTLKDWRKNNQTGILRRTGVRKGSNGWSAVEGLLH